MVLADNGTIFITWATGSYLNYSNPSAPAYPNNGSATGGVVYAPTYPDPASVASIVSGFPSCVSAHPFVIVSCMLTPDRLCKGGKTLHAQETSRGNPGRVRLAPLCRSMPRCRYCLR